MTTVMTGQAHGARGAYRAQIAKNIGLSARHETAVKQRERAKAARLRLACEAGTAKAGALYLELCGVRTTQPPTPSDATTCP